MVLCPAGVMVMVMPTSDMEGVMSVGFGRVFPAAQAGEKLRATIWTARKAVRSLREAEARADSRCSFMG